MSTRSLELASIVIILLVSLINPREAHAGVVIEQKVTTGAAGAPGRTANRTIMMQGDKEKFVIDDHLSIVIDPKGDKVIVIDSQHKIFRELPFKRVMGTQFDPNRLLYLPFKSTRKTRHVIGFTCEDYTGGKYSGPLMTTVAACFSTQPVGSREYSRFIKTELQRLGRRAQGVSIPAGVPLIVESTHGANPSFTMPDLPEKELLAFKSRIAKIPPQLTRAEVTKISPEKLSPDVFSTPTGYTRRGPKLD